MLGTSDFQNGCITVCAVFKMEFLKRLEIQPKVKQNLHPDSVGLPTVSSSCVFRLLPKLSDVILIRNVCVTACGISV